MTGLSGTTGSGSSSPVQNAQQNSGAMPLQFLLRIEDIKDKTYALLSDFFLI
ncbi:hypothetical protein MTR_8g106795 [Medicago truncatula]|uniref:Uncharacterized protein n=1 Tax=Medicago truncatula TaxID=3880 RepID=A0A072TX47_MEDTR|nr:hypothetical protein MTR_8g106795 [Medicago truncatula]